MVWRIICRDLGFDCNFIAKSDVDQDLMRTYARHLIEVHGYSQAQIYDRKVLKKVLEAIKQIDSKNVPQKKEDNI